MKNSNDRNVEEYVALLDRFTRGEVGAPRFENLYLRMFKSEKRFLRQDLYVVLQTLFEDVDAYVEDPALRSEPEDLDGEQLRVRAALAVSKLRERAGNSTF